MTEVFETASASQAPMLDEDAAVTATPTERARPTRAPNTASAAPRRPSTSARSASRDLKELVDNYERDLILHALAASGGNQRTAAAQLSVLPTTLNEKMKRLGLRAGGSASGASPATGPETCDEFLWRGRVNAGKTLELKSIHGTIDLAPSSDSHVSVVATRRRPADSPMAMDVRVAESAESVVVCVVPTAGAVPTDGRKRASGADLRVDFQVRVPRGVRVLARTFRGDVNIRGLLHEVDAETYAGRVRLWC